MSLGWLGQRKSVLLSVVEKFPEWTIKGETRGGNKRKKLTLIRLFGGNRGSENPDLIPRRIAVRQEWLSEGEHARDLTSAR